jgi:hypothetical protein
MQSSGSGLNNNSVFSRLKMCFPRPVCEAISNAMITELLRLFHFSGADAYVGTVFLA